MIPPKDIFKRVVLLIVATAMGLATLALTSTAAIASALAPTIPIMMDI